MAQRLWAKPTLNSLLNNKSLDIICLQETLLAKQDLACINTIHREFQGVGVSTTDNSE